MGTPAGGPSPWLFGHGFDFRSCMFEHIVLVCCVGFRRFQTSVGQRDLPKSVALPPQTPVGPRDLLEFASLYSRVSSGNVGSVDANLHQPVEKTG